MALFLVRLASEIATKARGTRRRFQQRLVRNIRDALRAAGIEASVEDCWSRLYVETGDRSAGGRVAAVFGVGSVSEVEARIPADLGEIVRIGEALYADRVRGRTFAVRSHRAGRFPFGTQDVRVQLGAALDRHGDVDLDHPEVTVTVELREREAFLYSGRIPGAGGLPLGVEGKAVALISGGFDSPVAAWLMLKRGIALEYVFCNLGGAAYERSVLGVVKVLADQWSFGERPVIHVVDFERPLEELRRTVQPRYWQVVLKRLMYRAAAAVAGAVRAEAIVTGEAVGQVSSQTLGNLAAISDAVTLPLFRPLLGLDKNEIIQRAERIGTAALSAQIREYCDIAQARPVTHASPRAARGEESKMDLGALDEAVAARKVVDLRSLQAVDLVAPYLFAEEVPDEAIVIDCREPQHYGAWHYPGAERRDLGDLAAQFKQLDKTRRYVLYCSFGVQSAYLAEAMQRAGYEAYSFKGGVRELKRYLSARPAAARSGLDSPAPPAPVR
ncbi:MAG: tRNA uracil 4-sulfurtransferase ThiI [Gemmatimonadales bacterium]